MQTNSEGVPRHVARYGNRIGRVATQTGRSQTRATRSAGGGVRSIMVTADDKLVLACSAVTCVALVEIEGRASSPYTVDS